MAPSFQPGQAVRPLNRNLLPPPYGWYSDDWRFRISLNAEAPGGFAIRSSQWLDKLVCHLQVWQLEGYGDRLAKQKEFCCWQWCEDFEADL